MITAAQATDYLDKALSMSLPAFLVASAVAKIATAEQAMVDAGYSAEDQLLVQTYAVAIIAVGGMPRRLSSQGAPSGANRSFKNYDEALTALRRTLAALDTAGTVAELVGPDPVASTLLLVTC